MRENTDQKKIRIWTRFTQCGTVIESCSVKNVNLISGQRLDLKKTCKGEGVPS